MFKKAEKKNHNVLISPTALPDLNIDLKKKPNALIRSNKRTEQYLVTFYPQNKLDSPG